MSATFPSHPSTPTTETKPPARPLHRRRKARGDVLCRTGARGMGRTVRAKLTALSHADAELVAPCPFALDEPVELEFLGTGSSIGCIMKATIARVAENVDGRWVVDCRFESTLAYSELAQLAR